MTCQGFLNLMDADGTPKDDVKVPETDIGKEVLGAFEEGKDLMVTIIASMGRSFTFSGSPTCRIRSLMFGSNFQMRSRLSPGKRLHRRTRLSPRFPAHTHPAYPSKTPPA